MKQHGYSDLNELLYRRHREGRAISKTELARTLGIWPSKLTALLNPESYRVSLDEELIQRIADVLQKDAAYVRNLYKTAA